MEAPETARQRATYYEYVARIFRAHVNPPEQMRYRTKLDGVCAPTVITNNQNLLLELLAGPCAEGNLAQTKTKECFMAVAADREEVWHLATETETWAENAAKMVRAMMRDIQQTIMKNSIRNMPDWVTPFLGANAKIAVITVTEDSQPEQLIYIYAWNDYMKTAVRIPIIGKDPRRRRGDPEPCKRLEKPADAKGTDNMVAHWQDGSTWAVPQQTVGQHKQSKEAKKIEAIWEGTKDDATISLKTSTSKDKSWLIIWSKQKGKRIYQVLQLATHVLPTDKMA